MKDRVADAALKHRLCGVLNLLTVNFNGVDATGGKEVSKAGKTPTLPRRRASERTDG